MPVKVGPAMNKECLIFSSAWRDDNRETEIKRQQSHLYMTNPTKKRKLIDRTYDTKLVPSMLHRDQRYGLRKELDPQGNSYSFLYSTNVLQQKSVALVQ
jgi:hypothetical protein